MHINFDQAEDFEALLAAEFNSDYQIPSTPGGDSYDMGYKIVDALACDLELDATLIDLDELGQA